MHRFLIVPYLLFCTLCTAQYDVHRSNAIPVSGVDGTLAHAWSGGFNSTQWNTMDLDQDGDMDIVIYDRTSDVLSTLMHDGNGNYLLDFDYASMFPPIDNWILLRDFNCDGKKDIFSSSPAGMKVYENVSTGTQLEFLLRTNLLETYFDFGVNPFYSNLYVSGIDIPSIDDFDGDGDLDIHTFTLAGQTIEYHQGLGADIGNCDSLTWQLANRCYGLIGEDAISPAIYIGQEFIDGEFCGFNVPNPRSTGDRSGRHAGSTLCTFDYDGNGQKDLLIGDISANNLAMILIEDRGPLQDSAIAVELDFPAQDVPVDVKVFNAAFWEDLDGDGVRDVIVSPANGPDCEDVESNWFYRNLGSNEQPDLQLQTTGLVQDKSIDIGTLSFPRAVDRDGDGDMDLVIGNRGKFQEDGTYEESLTYYENVGNDSAPELTWVESDLWSLSELGIEGHMAPAFGDIDGDGDSDLIIGDGQGRLHMLINQGGTAAPMVFGPSSILELDGEELDLGANLIPQLFDLDDDGLLDLIVGERNGNTNHLRNVGSSAQASWELVEDTLGGIVTDLDGNLVGYSAPWFYRDNEGVTHGLIGTEHGQIFYLEDVPDDPSEEWAIADSMAFSIDNGDRSCPVMLDWNGDGILDIINGVESGGLALYLSGAAPESVSEPISASTWTIFPNPGTETLFITGADITRIRELRVFDTQGRLVIERQNNNLASGIDITPLQTGVYHVLIESDSRREMHRFIKR